MKILRNVFFTLFAITAFYGCNRDESQEKYINWNSHLVNMSDSIQDIKTSIIFGDSWLYILDNYLILCENSPSGNKGVHVFNKNTFEYITSTAIVGEGPGDVARQGRIAVNPNKHEFWLSDYAKMVMWRFPIDSVLHNSKFKPSEKFDLYSKLFIEKFGFLNDTIALGKGVGVISNNSFAMHMVKLNLRTNTTKPFGYEHPKSVGKGKSNSTFAISVNHGFYVNCYYYIDLVTICDLEGKLRCNIYGSSWNTRKNDKNVYFYGVDIYHNYVIGGYINDKGFIFDQNQRPRGNLPSKLAIMDSNGNHIKTLEIGYKFKYFCVDEQNKRVIFYFDDRENPLGYINLNLSQK